MAEINYVDAWQLWLDGRSAIGYNLLGMPMIWWGRIGKILSFVAGAAIVVDLVGSEKLARYSERLTRRMNKGLGPWVGGALTCLLGVAVGSYFGVSADAMFPLIVGISVCIALVLGAVTDAMKHPRLATTTRWASLLLFIVGFHFDLRAS